MVEWAVSSLTKGVYVVAIVTKQGTVNKRLVVK
ncbi:MAG: T9SS type A sorting domain-containing protein [Bacteroidales bacterium]|nr:T9SS type A sorting domain-containing protein [Bacteroidales bacterium]